MGNELTWYTREKTLVLHGVLDRNTLSALWECRTALFYNIQFLDVSNLKKVDSTGVALILHIVHHQRQRNNSFSLTGITDQLEALIFLYKLKIILPEETQRQIALLHTQVSVKNKGEINATRPTWR